MFQINRFPLENANCQSQTTVTRLAYQTSQKMTAFPTAQLVHRTKNLPKNSMFLMAK